jgi:hypothetical protein
MVLVPALILIATLLHLIQDFNTLIHLIPSSHACTRYICVVFGGALSSTNSVAWGILGSHTPPSGSGIPQFRVPGIYAADI